MLSMPLMAKEHKRYQNCVRPTIVSSNVAACLKPSLFPVFTLSLQHTYTSVDVCSCTHTDTTQILIFLLLVHLLNGRVIHSK